MTNRENAIDKFGAGPRAYALVTDANNLTTDHRNLLLLWIAEHYPMAFRRALALVGDLNPAADWPVST